MHEIIIICLMRTIFFISLIFSVVFAKKHETPNAVPILNRYFTMVQGFLQGFNQGFYQDKAYETDDQCFGDTTIDSILTLMDLASDRWFLKVIDLVTATYTLMQSTRESCQIESVFFDVTAFCYTHPCDGYTIMNNS